MDYYNTYKVVTNNIANKTYVLYQCGTPIPTNIPSGAKLFQIPLTSVSAPETVPYAFLELLGLDDRVSDVSPYVTSPCGQKILECGHISPDFLKLENTTMLKATVGPTSDGLLATEPYEFEKSFAFSANLEPGALAYTEWIKFLGLFFNRERYASDVYAGIVQEYNAKKVTASGGADAPVIAFVTHYLYEEDESYQISFASFKKEISVDAGGAFLDFDTIAAIPGVRPTAYSPVDLEFAWGGNDTFETQAEARTAFLKVLQSVDAVIDESYALDSAAYNLASFKTEFGLNEDGVDLEALPWLTNKIIFREDGLISKDNGMDWYEGAITRPGKVLVDMIRVVGAARNGAAPTDTDFTWIRGIEQVPTILGPDACQRVASCDAKPAPFCPFVAMCGDGSSVLLKSSTSAAAGEACEYEACASAVAAEQPPVANTAQMAAPAVIMLTVLVIFVEALINFC